MAPDHSEGPFMKSPFPGMDPYIEASGRWEDFHKKLIGDIERALAAALPPRYRVSLVERSYVVLAGRDGKDASAFLPDLGVTVGTGEPRGRASALTAVVEAVTDDESVPLRAY